MRGALAILLLACAGPALADCTDWQAADGQVRELRVEALSGVGNLHVRQIFPPMGYGYHRHTLAVAWHDAQGRLMQQLLSDEAVLSSRPVIELDGDALLVRIADCSFRGTCRPRIERHVFIEGANRFHGTARWASFEFDPDNDTWRPAPPRADAPVPTPDCPADDAFVDAHDLHRSVGGEPPAYVIP